MAVDAHFALSPARLGPRHRADARGRAEYEVAHILRRAAGHRRQAQCRHRRHPRCAVGRHAAHPAGAGVGRGLLPRFGQILRSGGDPLRGADRNRRRVPGRLRRGGHPRGDVLGGRPSLRLATAQPEGDGGAAAPGRGCPRHRGAAGRPADPGRGVGGGGQRDDRRRRRDRRVRRSPSNSAATPTWI